MEISLVSELTDDVKALIDKDEIKEQFHYGAEYKFVCRKDEALVGIIAYRKGNFSDGAIAPQFIHVIISDEFRGKDEPREFLKITEDCLKDLGFKMTFCHIPFKKKYMQNSAMKHGYEEFDFDEDGIFYYKNLV